MNEKTANGCAYVIILFWLAWIVLICWGLFELIMWVKRS